jgi:sulfate permease, SulP family
MIAVLESYKAGLFSKGNILNNIIAGIIVGVVALPLAMAFAIASGAKPEQGLYTAIIAGLITTLCGGSRLQISGPTGAFIAILAGITLQYGIEGLQIATFMAGIILFIMGLAKFGGLMKFISQPVIVGFTAGIGVIIWVGQWKDFFGLKPEATGTHFHEKLWGLVQAFPSLHVPTMLLALCGLAIVIITPKIQFLKRVPGPLIAMIAVTLIQYAMQFDGVATIGSTFGEIPRTLPEFKFLNGLTADHMIELASPAFAIAMLGAIESLLSAKVADGMAGTKFNANQELVGQGLANMVVPFFGGFAATGAIARTATNIRNGATSPLAGVVHCLTLVAVILLLAPLAAYVPLCVLSAVLFVVAWNMSELHYVKHVFKTAPRSDIAIMVIAFVLTVFIDLVVAVEICVVLSALLFMQRMSSSVDLSIDNDARFHETLSDGDTVYTQDEVASFSIKGPLFFAAADHFEQKLQSLVDKPRVIVLRLGHVPYMDLTGIHRLGEMIDSFHKQGIRIILSDVHENLYKKLHKAGVLNKLSPGGILS